jgi:hypothetical protein
MIELQSRQKSVKSIGNTSVKIRAMEEERARKEQEWDKERRKYQEEAK